MSIEDDRFMNNIENQLIRAEAIPGLGTVAGGVHVVVGGLQAITALAATAITLPYALKDTSPLKHSWHHLEHGLGNMAAGTLGAIPGAGTLLFYVRRNREPKFDESVHIVTGHENKWMPYSSLIETDLKIVGPEEDPQLREANHLFDQRYENHKKKQHAEPNNRRLKHLAKKAVIDTTAPILPKTTRDYLNI